MRAGYLCLQTHVKNPGLVRVLISEHMPESGGSGTESALRYVALFNDVEAAQMHVHNALRSKLIDLNNRIYRSGLVDAMAAIEADGLAHRRVWIDPALNPDELRRLAYLTSERRFRDQRIDRIWQTVGGIAIAFLVFLLLTSSR